MVLICLDILEISLSNYKIVDSDSFSIIETFLNSKPQVTVVSIRKLQRDCNEISSYVPKSTILLLIKCLSSQHVNIGPPTINLLCIFLNDNFLDDDDINFQLSSLLETSNTEVLCRTYEVSVGIACKNYSSFEKIKIPIIDKCLNDLASGSDVLLQLNILEILQALCMQDYGFSYLENKDILNKLARKIEEANEDALSALLIPGLMKFFGTIAAKYPQKIFQNYSSLFDLLFNCIIENQPSLIYSALDTLGYLSKSNECKKSLDKDYGEKFPWVLANIYNNISNYSSDVKLRAFLCLENAFSLDGDPDMVNNQITCICENWCKHIFEDMNDFSSLLNFCKTPFDDLSQSVFGFLKSLSHHSFGQKGIAKSAGFIEFLLDRKIGSSYEIKQKKFEVIEVLAKSSIFDANTIANFNKYIREGANFVEPMSEVSFEPS